MPTHSARFWTSIAHYAAPAVSRLALLVMLIAVLVLPTYGWADTPAPPDTGGAAVSGEIGEYVEGGRAVLEAIDKGDGWMAAALALSLLVLILRRSGARWLPDGPPAGESDARKIKLYTRLAIVKRWIGSGEGGVVLTVLGAVLTGVVSTLSAGISPLSWIGVRSIVKVAVAALGGFAGISHTLGAKGAQSRAARREAAEALKAAPAASVTPAP